MFELHARVSSVYVLYRIAERVEIVSKEQWLGEKPNGDPIYSTKGLIKGASPGGEFEEPDLTKAAPPTIYREDGRVRLVVVPAPK